MSPQFSIDLEAELRKISQRQHLNQVHFMIALVRHALTCDPTSIHIQQQQQKVTIAHNGHAFSLMERKLLEIVMDGLQHSDTRQEALSKLEKNHGVAVLSLFFNFDRVQIRSENWQLNWQNGGLQRQTSETATEGYQIIIHGANTSIKKAREELNFYVGDCDVAVAFNGAPIKEPFQFKDPILLLRFENAHGRGQICIPAHGDLSTVTFMKRGVRFGVTRATPPSGLIYLAFWSSNATSYEGNFNKSIERGFEMIETECEKLYDAIRQHYRNLPEAHKLRVKRILVGATIPNWTQRFGNIPLFHSANAPFNISMRDLRTLLSRFGYIPYITQANASVPNFIPRLLPEDVHFLRHRFQMHLALYQGRNPSGRSEPDQTNVLGLDPDALTITERLFLKALNSDDPYCRFSFAANQQASYIDTTGVRHVRLNREDATVQQAINAVEEDATMALPWKFRLLKHV